MSTLWYSTLGGNKLQIPGTGDEFAITHALNDISYFDFAIANTADNRTIIAANITQDFLVKRKLDDLTIFTGRIADLAYNDRTMLLTGHSAYVTLLYETFKHIPTSDLMNPTHVRTWTPAGGAVDLTTEATNPTINDVPCPFSTSLGAVFFGHSSPFNAIKVKYSTKGVCAAHDISYIYYKQNGSAAEAELGGVLDLSQGFTKDAGTYYIMFDMPERWAQLVSGNYMMGLRISATSTLYSTPPILDQIWIGKPTKSEADDRPITPFRIEYIDTAANTILGDVLAGTGYTIGACPSTHINIRGEYMYPLQWIALIASRLKQIISGDTYPYEWCIDDTLKKVEILTNVGLGPSGEVSENFTFLEHIIHYGQKATRVLGLGAFNSRQQLSSYAEDYDASELREIVVSDLKCSNREAFDDKTEMILAELKEPPRELPVKTTTDWWVDNCSGPGVELDIYRSRLGITSPTGYRVKRAVIGPIFTKLTLGIRGRHMEDIRSQLQSKLDVLNIWQAGAAEQSNDGGYF